MPLNNSQYDSIIREYEKTRTLNRHLYEQRRSEVYNKIPAYKDLENNAAAISISQGRKLLSGDTDALLSLKEQLAALLTKKTDLLIRCGFPKDYLEPTYNCPVCKDSGYANNQKCRCLKNAIIDVLYEQSNLRERLNEENFSVLSHKLHQGKDLENFIKAERICRSFTENFPNNYRNILLYGQAGSGKSFLSSCVAKELLDKGFAVIYFSAVRFFETLSHNSFDNSLKESLAEMHDDVYNCDLLILDDLGTEFIGEAFVDSQLFSCLNERALRKRATVISTNLSLPELQNHYSDRIFSRLISGFEVCQLTLTGKNTDIRLIKKRNYN